MIQPRRIAHATFETLRFDEALAYYTDVVGLHVAGRDNTRAFLATHGGLLTAVIEKASQSRCAKLAFEVAPGLDLSDLQGALSEHSLRSELQSDPVPGVARSLSLVDPNGTIIELFSESSSSDRQLSPRGVGALKLGHVAFYSRDPAEMAKFYQTILGFKISDWIEDFFVFMRCNADHHTVNFLRGDRPRMHHIAFELKDAAHVCASCDVLTAQNIPLEWGPLRLGPGHNIAAFHRDCDGQLVEFYSELDQMKDEVLGYWDPRPWHREAFQRPKVWKREDDPIWGAPPPKGFL